MFCQAYLLPPYLNVTSQGNTDIWKTFCCTSVWFNLFYLTLHFKFSKQRKRSLFRKIKRLHKKSHRVKIENWKSEKRWWILLKIIYLSFLFCVLLWKSVQWMCRDRFFYDDVQTIKEIALIFHFKRRAKTSWWREHTTRWTEQNAQRKCSC